MKNMKYNIIVILLFFAVGLMSCENEEENISFKPGTDLIIKTRSALNYTGETGVFYVDGYTVTEKYNWSVSGAGATVEKVEGRGDEFVEVTATQVGTVTLTVENDKGLKGSIEIDVIVEPAD